MTQSIEQRLAQGPPLLADGAMGTMLQQRGLPIGTRSDEWGVTHADLVTEIHAAYGAAGSEMVLTNTLSANAQHFSPERVEQINAAAVRAARASGARWVAGSMGPGAGEAQALALAAAGVDLFWIETQLSLDEALRSVAACQRVAALPLFVSFSFHREDGLTQNGESAHAVARALTEQGVTAVGLNCGHGLEGIAGRLAEMAAATSLPLVLKPNAGLPERTEGGWRYPLAPMTWATRVVAAKTSQVRVVGGCCGSSPQHLAALAQLIKKQEA